MKGQDYRKIIKDIRFRLHYGLITYEQAKEEAQIFIDLMNKTGSEIAKKHGMHFKPFTFSGLMR